MNISEIDFQQLGTAISILAKSNPITALATGIVSGIFGKALFDKAKNKRKSKAEKKLQDDFIQQILKNKEGEDA
jgi:hypothetical protein